MTLYSDLDISFNSNPLSGDLSLVTDVAAVSQSVKTLILTSIYERPFQPSLGSFVKQLLFSPYDSVSKRVLADTIKEVINKFEPRAELKFVDFYNKSGPNGEQLDDNSIVINVGFFVLNKPDLVTLTVILKRIR